MADSKISEMAEITSYDENVIAPVVVSDGGNFVNKMIRLKNIKGRDYIAGNGINIINDVISTNDAEINKQNTLVSGVNIKTINGMTLLGSGNITVEGGGTGGEVYVAGYGISITEGNAVNVDTNELNNVYQAKMGSDDNYVTDLEKTKLSNLSGVNTGDQDLSGLLPKTDAALTYQPLMGSDDNYVTDLEKTKLSNLSGTNSGDETESTIKTKLGITTLSGANTGDETTSTIKTKLGITTLSGVNTGDQDLTPYLTKVEAGSTYQPLMGSDDNYMTDDEKIKLSNLSGDQDLSEYLTKVEASNDYQIKMGLDDNYVTDDEKTKLSNLSGVNTGDQDLTPYLTIVDASNDYQPIMGTDDNYVTDDEKTKLSNLSGVNTGDQDLTPYLTIANASTTYQPIMGIDDNYMTDDEKVKLSNLSGVNTGDETESTIKTKLGITTLSGVNTGDQDLTPYLTKVEAGSTYQPLMGSDDNYMTDAEKIKLSNLSGDQDLSNYLTLAGGTISGNLSINGDLVVQGTGYETSLETLNVKNNYLKLRDGAITGMVVGEYAGIEAVLYDGVNNGRLIFDKDGIAKVGDVGSEQPLATRELNPTNNSLAVWNTDASRFQTGNSLIFDGSKLKVNMENVSIEGHTHNYVPTTRTVTAGAGMTGGGSLSGNITLSHADTSNATSITVTNTGTNVLQNLTVSLDTYGHVTNASSSSVDLSQTLVLKSEFNGHTHTGVYVPITIPNAITASAYTFVIGDAYKLISFGSSSATSVTVPTNSSVAYAIGTQIDCYQAGTGAVTFVGASGVTINSLNNNKTINGQYVGVSLIKTGTNSWLLVGNLKA